MCVRTRVHASYYGHTFVSCDLRVRVPTCRFRTCPVLDTPSVPGAAVDATGEIALWLMGEGVTAASAVRAAQRIAAVWDVTTVAGLRAFKWGDLPGTPLDWLTRLDVTLPCVAVLNKLIRHVIGGDRATLEGGGSHTVCCV